MPLICAFSYVTQAANLYVAVNGADSGDCQNTQNRCRTVGYAISRMSGGDTLLIGDGVYNSSNDAVSAIPSGSIGGYTTIRAENISKNESKVTINQTLKVEHKKQYIRIDGLKFTGNNEKSIEGHHIKITRSSFEGGPVDRNTTNLVFGTNNHLDTHHILLEDSAVYGLGGRYKVLVYQARDIIIRRVVIRPDGGWQLNPSQPGAGYGSTPEAGISIYNSPNIELQNVIVLDGMTTAVYNGKPESWTSAFYFPLSSDSPYPSENVRTVGSIALNNIGTSYMYENSVRRKSTTLENSVAWKPVGASGFVAKGAAISAGVGLVMNNLTLINVYDTAIGNWHNGGDIQIKNSILTNYNNHFDAAGAVIESNNVCFGGTACKGANDKNYDPLQNGLSFLTRADSAPIKSAGENASQAGATIINQIGKSDTFYGDKGFNLEQNTPLWPWANEERIKRDFCGASNVKNRGFCAARTATLTEYVWGALGGTTPTDLRPMGSPANPKYMKN